MALTALCLLILAMPACLIFAQGQPPATQPAAIADVRGLDANGQLQLTVNRTTAISANHPFKRISTGQPDIADVNAVSPTSILVTAKKPGATQVILWDDQDRATSFEVVVDLDLRTLQDQYRRLFADSVIDVSSANGALVLRGRVSNITVSDQAAQLAEPYGAKVMNFLEVAGGQQVMLQVRFAEVSRSAVSALGVNGAMVAKSAFAGSNIGQVNPTALIPGKGSVLGNSPAHGLNLSADQAVSPNVTLFGGGQIGSVFLEGFVEALRQNDLLRILAEPNLIAISGQEASFLAGGEYPIPVVQGGGGTGGGTAISIEYKQFGVKLMFVPIVLGNGKIRLKVAPEVSDLDFTTAVRFGGYVIPGLSQRKVSTTVELADGQSFAIAGLLNNSITATKDVVPGLGDLPVIGVLFRSVRYQRKETELVVLVTPRVVAPMIPGQIPTLPGEKWRDPTEAELFGNQDMGGPVTDKKSSGTAGTAGAAPAFYGQYGFTPPSPPAQ